jgi:hypothetical protein
MALSPEEVLLCKNYLGYSNMTALANPYMDTAVMFEQIVQMYTDKVGEDIVSSQLLPQITQVRKDIFAARSRYKVGEVPGDYKQNPMEHRKLLELLEWLLNELSKTLGVPRAKRRDGSFTGSTGSSSSEVY